MCSVVGKFWNKKLCGSNKKTKYYFTHLSKIHEIKLYWVLEMYFKEAEADVAVTKNVCSASMSVLDMD